MEEPKKNNIPKTTNKLSILIDQGGLSFCITDLLKPKTITFSEKKFEKALEPAQILEQIELVFEQYKMDFKAVEKTQVLFSNTLYGFVPLPLFDENYLSDYLKFNTKILSTDFISYDELKSLGLCNVYIPYANITNYFFDKFGIFEYKHAASVLVQNVLCMENEAQNESVYVNVFYTHFDIVVVKDKKMLLCNSFPFDTPEDFVYYILFVAEQLKLDPEKFPLIFLGAISETSELYKICHTYIRNCSFLKEESSLQKEFDLFKSKESTPNYVLLKTHTCV